MTRASNLPTLEQMADESAGLVTMAVIIPTICPGFLLCVPGLVLAVFPVIALAVLAAAGALLVAVAAVPLLAARALARRTRHALVARRRIAQRRAGRADEAFVVESAGPRAPALR